jgi:hypothetical protein
MLRRRHHAAHRRGKTSAASWLPRRQLCVRRGAALECLDDEHAAAAATARVREFGVLGAAAILRRLGAMEYP